MSATPLVSICVPNLNTRPFLPERFATIQAQTLTDWELLVYDSYSTDGAWEYIRKVERGEPRLRAWQGPREGTPGSWNPCIREARGRYVYIATSDDTMAPDCLERLVDALEAHPECDLAHCPLRPIDQEGRERPDLAEWWRQGSAFAAASGTWLNRAHVRRPPHDGLLHLLGASVYISITQLLIRRSLFDRIGGFESRWGSVGDFNWSMRAGLVTGTVHVPDTWGGWRVHPAQATAFAAMGSPDHIARVDSMIQHAVETSRHELAPVVREQLTGHWVRQASEFRDYVRRAGACRGRFDFARLLAGDLCAGARPVREHIGLRLRGRPMHHWAARQLERLGFPPAIVPA
jgi:hypothetical protein